VQINKTVVDDHSTFPTITQNRSVMGNLNNNPPNEIEMSASNSKKKKKGTGYEVDMNRLKQL
jgi:hypothetical protein